MNMANELYNQVLNERNLMRQLYGQMYDDEYRHMQQEIEAWAQNLQAETQRYAQDQETARNNAKIAAQNKAADINRYLNSGWVWDGNEWVNPNQLNQPNMQSYIDSYGNSWSPQTGAVNVEPIQYTTPSGSNANAYVATPEMLAQLMYGGN
jgi:hypothetical protein